MSYDVLLQNAIHFVRYEQFSTFNFLENINQVFRYRFVSDAYGFIQMPSSTCMRDSYGFGDELVWRVGSAPPFHHRNKSIIVRLGRLGDFQLSFSTRVSIIACGCVADAPQMFAPSLTSTLYEHPQKKTREVCKRAEVANPIATAWTAYSNHKAITNQPFSKKAVRTVVATVNAIREIKEFKTISVIQTIRFIKAVIAIYAIRAMREFRKIR